MQKNRAIGISFFAAGCLFLAAGAYLIIAKNERDQPTVMEPASISPTKTNDNAAPPRSANNFYKPSAKKDSEAIKPSPKSNPAAENKQVTATKAVVEETPPYPAEAGTKWTKSGNGWILGHPDRPLRKKQGIKPQGGETEAAAETRDATKATAHKPCSGKMITVNGIKRCISQ